MEVHLVDGTYELFRHFYAVPSRVNARGEEIGAARGVVTSIVAMLEAGATHLGVATDAVITSFRNALYPGYKTGEGIDPDLFAQFPLLDGALAALGVTVWPMIDQEADDGLAAAAEIASRNASVSRVFICTPDKDLAQCVVGRRIVQFDRRRELIIDEEAVRAKFGVDPVSIPDFLGLTGDSADGFPGLPGWGAKSAAGVLGVYGHLEAIPHDHELWKIPLRGAAKLSATLRAAWTDALLFRDIATVRRDHQVGTVEAWEYRGPTDAFDEWIERLDAPRLSERVRRLRG